MKSKSSWLYPYILLSLMAAIPLLGLFQKGLPVTHDGQDHVARISNFYQSLSEGNIVPRWAANLNWGFGHPVLMFLYPLPSYIASLFHASGFPLVDSFKITLGVTFILSVLSMYALVTNIWGTKAAMIAALLYGFAPYRFVDLYVRGALGEHTAFIFPPLICLCLLKCAAKGSLWWIGLAIFTGGLILSHNALAIMFLPMAMLYGIYVYRYEAAKNVIYAFRVLMGFVLGFTVSAFFWIPAYFEGKYTLRDIVTGDPISDRFVPLAKLITPDWNYGGGNDFTKFIGWMQIIGLLSGAFYLWHTRDKRTKYLMYGAYAVFALSLLLMNRTTEPIWDRITILQKFQFPWRLLSVSVFTASVICGWSYSMLMNRFFRIQPKLRNLGLGVLILAAVCTTYPMWHASSYELRPDSFYSGIYHGTTDTGESSPIWSVRFMEREPNRPLEVVSGAASVVGSRKSTTIHTYLMEIASSSRVVENTLYFPGWSVSIDGNPVPVEFQNPAWRGLMTFEVPAGQHTVDVKFGATKLRKVADGISFASLIIILLVLVSRLFSVPPKIGKA
jgi:hypothetical protein